MACIYIYIHSYVYSAYGRQNKIEKKNIYIYSQYIYIYI